VILDRNIVPALVPLYEGETTHPRLTERARFGEGAGQPVIVYEILWTKHGS
jgi:hypothetical protein